MEEIVNPGINPLVRLGHFTDQEKKIIRKISSEWYELEEGELKKE